MQINIRDGQGNSERVATWDQVSVNRDGEALRDVCRISLNVRSGDVVEVEVERYDTASIRENHLRTYVDRYIVTASSLPNIILSVIDVGIRYLVLPNEDNDRGNELELIE